MVLALGIIIFVDDYFNTILWFVVKKDGKWGIVNDEQDTIIPFEYDEIFRKPDDYDYFTGQIQCLQITDDNHPELKAGIEEYFNGLVKNFNSGIDEMNEQAKQQNEDFGDDEYTVKEQLSILIIFL